MSDDTAVAIHMLLSAPPKSSNWAEWHFTIRQMALLGLDSGVSGGLFAKRLRDLSEQEAFEKDEKRRKELEDLLAFAARSVAFGKKIMTLRKQLDDTISFNEHLTKDIEEQEPKEKYTDRLQQLKDDRIKLDEYSEQLDDIEEQRMETSSNAELSTVERFFGKFTTRYKSFIDGLKARKSSTNFNFKSSPGAEQDDEILYESGTSSSEKKKANAKAKKSKHSDLKDTMNSKGKSGDDDEDDETLKP